MFGFAYFSWNLYCKFCIFCVINITKSCPLTKRFNKRLNKFSNLSYIVQWANRAIRYLSTCKHPNTFVKLCVNITTFVTFQITTIPCSTFSISKKEMYKKCIHVLNTKKYILQFFKVYYDIYHVLMYYKILIIRRVS